MVKKALKKSKNDILHACLGHISKTHSKRIFSIVDDINGDPSKICFCESCISSKIMRNPNTKSISEVTTKLSRVYIDLWGSFPNISLEGNHYICIATDQAIRQVWMEFWPNKKELLQSI